MTPCSSNMANRSEDNRPHIVAVHGGAGFHAQSCDAEVKRALRSACMSALARGDSATHLVIEAISILEDEEYLNAGYGSNLTMNGSVECDASIMDGLTGDFGAVGAIPGVKHPVQAAHEVLRYSRTSDPLSRIPPLLLVSSGASEFAKSRNLECIPPESLISPRAEHEWAKWKSQLEHARANQQLTSSEGIDTTRRDLNQVDGMHERQDTVGAVVWDASGNLAAGVSSGGLLLKLPGRVGEAAIYGAGCWATQNIACSVSGAGEYITRLSLARTICDAIEAAGDNQDTHGILETILGGVFRKLCSERGERSPQAGILLLAKERDDDGQHTPRLWCAFTTDSMAIGFASSLSQRPFATILRRPPRPPGNAPAPSQSVYITALPLHRGEPRSET
ncbi:nucleophile aminohydrolase [Fomes fomentarius]|nr:nucleophile aminohydrolase [Fomes fomentarius]